MGSIQSKVGGRKRRFASQSREVAVHNPPGKAMTDTTLSEDAPSRALQGRVYAITGGASGIGFATAKILSKRGATVCVADVDAQAMKAAEEHFKPLGVPFMITKVDISKRSEVESWIATIVQRFGRLHGAANVAGIIGKVHGITDVADMIDEEWNKILAVNLTGTMYCMRAELNNIVNGGSIVNVSSIHGLKGNYPTALVAQNSRANTLLHRLRQARGI